TALDAAQLRAMTNIDKVQIPANLEVNEEDQAIFLQWGLDNALPNETLQELWAYSVDFEVIGAGQVTEQAVADFHKPFAAKLSVDQRTRLLRWYLSDR